MSNSIPLAVTAWESLFRAQVSVLQYLNADFPTNELTFAEYDLLFNVYQQRGKGLRVKDLREHLLQNQSSVSRLIDRIAARGLLTKMKDPDDARGIIVELTDEGFHAFKIAADIHMKSISTRFDGVLNDAELATLIELCLKLRQGSPPRKNRRS